MDILENFREGLRSIRANLLRSILTAAIVAIGITSLVGILTAIDGIQQSVTDSLSELGVNKFDITSKQHFGRRTQGRAERSYPRLTLNDASLFVKRYNYPSMVSLSTLLSGAAEVKSGSKKTNPNVRVFGVNEDYLILEGVNIAEGRNFSLLEVQYGSNVAIIGPSIRKALFDNDLQALNSTVSYGGSKFKIIGITEEKGQLEGGGTDNSIFIPIIAAARLAGDRELNFDLSVGIDNPEKIEEAMGEATGVMRVIRHDKIGEENSFKIARSETLAEELENVTGVMRLGGFGVGFITLLGAAIALMNIMMVSVTERTREVGVRKALGATPKKIRQQFLIEAIVVCLLGGVAGIILGITIGNFVSRLIGIEGYVIPWLWIFFGITICVVVGIISGYYPAHKASKVDPIESLRFE